jgi:hypothetical protein
MEADEELKKWLEESRAQYERQQAQYAEERRRMRKSPKKLYAVAMDPNSEFRTAKSHYYSHDLGENMELIEALHHRQWQPSVLLDHDAKRAYVVMHWDKVLDFIGEKDVVWESLEGLEPKAVERAYHFRGVYPVKFGKFENGVASIEWQINPDGMYFMDSDGYGITDDEERPLFAFVDRQLRVLLPFRYLSKSKKIAELDRMRAEAEALAKKKWKWMSLRHLKKRK